MNFIILLSETNTFWARGLGKKYPQISKLHLVQEYIQYETYSLRYLVNKEKYFQK